MNVLLLLAAPAIGPFDFLFVVSELCIFSQWPKSDGICNATPQHNRPPITSVTLTKLSAQINCERERGAVGGYGDGGNHSEFIRWMNATLSENTIITGVATWACGSCCVEFIMAQSNKLCGRFNIDKQSKRQEESALREEEADILSLDESWLTFALFGLLVLLSTTLNMEWITYSGRKSTLFVVIQLLLAIRMRMYWNGLEVKTYRWQVCFWAVECSQADWRMFFCVLGKVMRMIDCQGLPICDGHFMNNREYYGLSFLKHTADKHFDQ